MRYLSLFSLLALLATMNVWPEDSDAVNERIPVSRLELEDHWQVDCQGDWDALVHSVQASQTADGSCTTTTALARSMKLCSYIYQPPGGSTLHSCPDYRSVNGILEKVGETENCHQLHARLQRHFTCMEPPQDNKTQ